MDSDIDYLLQAAQQSFEAPQWRNSRDYGYRYNSGSYIPKAQNQFRSSARNAMNNQALHSSRKSYNTENLDSLDTLDYEQVGRNPDVRSVEEEEQDPFAYGAEIRIPDGSSQKTKRHANGNQKRRMFNEENLQEQGTINEETNYNENLDSQENKNTKRDSQAWSKQQISALKKSLATIQENSAEYEHLKSILNDMGLLEFAPVKRESSINEKEDENLIVNDIPMKKNKNKRSSLIDETKSETVNKRSADENSDENSDNIQNGDKSVYRKNSELDDDQNGGNRNREDTDNEGDRQKRDSMKDTNSGSNNSPDLMKGLEKSGELTVSGNKSPLASDEKSDSDSISEEKMSATGSEKEKMNKRNTNTEYEDYEQMVESEIQSKINAIKDKVKRAILMKKQKHSRNKRDTSSLDTENKSLNPDLITDESLQPHKRIRRKVNRNQSTTQDEHFNNTNTVLYDFKNLKAFETITQSSKKNAKCMKLQDCDENTTTDKEVTTEKENDGTKCRKLLRANKQKIDIDENTSDEENVQENGATKCRKHLEVIKHKTDENTSDEKNVHKEVITERENRDTIKYQKLLEVIKQKMDENVSDEENIPAIDTSVENFNDNDPPSHIHRRRQTENEQIFEEPTVTNPENDLEKINSNAKCFCGSHEQADKVESVTSLQLKRVKRKVETYNQKKLENDDDDKAAEQDVQKRKIPREDSDVIISVDQQLSRKRRSNNVLPENKLIFRPYLSPQDEEEEVEGGVFDNNYDQSYVEKRNIDEQDYQYVDKDYSLPENAYVGGANMDERYGRSGSESDYSQDSDYEQSLYAKRNVQYKFDRDKRDNEDSQMHGGGMISRKSSLKNKAMSNDKESIENVQSIENSDQDDTGNAENDFFGGLPQNYQQGELNRYKRVKRNKDNK